MSVDDAPTVDLPPALAEAVEAFASRDRVLVALDFDGTLAPIVDDPDAARPLPAAVEALTALSAAPRTRVAVVSGRPVARLRSLLGPVGPVALVGSHGAEITTADADDDDALLGSAERALLERLRAEVTQIVRRHPGTALEDKPAAVVLHTRRADRPSALAATVDALLGPGRRDGVHVLAGKEVVELAVTDATKGGALRRLRADLGLELGGVLYAGDDTTDELAFTVLDDDAGDVTIKVGAGETAARHRLDEPAELVGLLTLLATRRRRG